MDKERRRSSLDTGETARSLSKEDRKQSDGSHASVAESNSSLDTLTGISEDKASTENSGKTGDKKKGRFGALKNTFRKEGGLFKTKKKHKSFDCQTSTDIEFYEDDINKGRLS